MSLAQRSVDNPVAVNLFMWLIILGGLYYAITLEREMFPSFEPEQITLRVVQPGAVPEDLARSVTRLLERGLQGVDGVERITSRVTEGLSATTIEVQDGFDRTEVLNDVRGEVDRVAGDLPVDAEEPVLEAARPFFPVIGVVVNGDVDPHHLDRVALDVRDGLLDLPGVNRVLITGRRKKEIHVTVSPERLEEYELTFEELGQTLRGLNLDAPGGTLEGDRGNVGVRTLGERRRALALESQVIRRGLDGSTLRLSDLGAVSETFEDRVEDGRFEGKPAVLLTVFKTPEEDALEIAAAVKAYVAKNDGLLGGAVGLGTVTDLSRFIEQRLDLMIRNAKWGLLLVAIALALFLELRVAFWVALGMPISFLGTFALMEWWGSSINL
ncbi:MAG: efflux RND transporter permease subunit, partial [Planctomycetes bacterium]|nr:efflux RND transporter permease subunit [Planctomycetota bacterium]